VHDPEKSPSAGPDPRVEAGFPKDHAPAKSQNLNRFNL
jgi:hypothetical protein